MGKKKTESALSLSLSLSRNYEFQPGSVEFARPHAEYKLLWGELMLVQTKTMRSRPRRIPDPSRYFVKSASRLDQHIGCIRCRVRVHACLLLRSESRVNMSSIIPTAVPDRFLASTPHRLQRCTFLALYFC